MRQAPAHLRPSLLGTVALGGVVGTLARDQLESALPVPPGAFPWTTFAINVAGAFLLGALLESLGRLGPETARRRAARLGLGTGVLGGFTTYSTFVLEAVALAPTRPALAVLYALGSVVAGFAAALLALRLARLRVHREGRA